METNRIRNVAVRFWASPQTDETVRKVATAEGRSISEVYRGLVEKGLVAGGYRSGSQDMAALVREAVQETLRPHVDRLAAISAKGTQISAAAFFLAAYNGKLAIPDYMKGEYDEIASHARKLGIEYLKLSKDKNLDDFIGRGLDRIGEDDV